MVHKHSPAKLRERRLRALELGFVVPKGPGGAGHQHVLVPRFVAAPVKTMAAALAAHSELDAITGECHHTLAAAALAAKPLLPEGRFRSTMALNKAAGTAKHQPPRAAGGAALELRNSKQEKVDPLVANDPWAGRRTSSNAAKSSDLSPPKQFSSPSRFLRRRALSVVLNVGRISVVPSASTRVGVVAPEAASRPDSQVMRADAPEYVPGFGPGSCSGRPEVEVLGPPAYWEQLVEAQNSTIARLSGLLEGTTPGARKVKQLELKLEALSKTLSSSVSAEVSSCAARVAAEVGSHTQAVFERMLQVAESLSGRVRQLEEQRGLHDCTPSAVPAAPPQQGPRYREMPCKLFFEVAQACKGRLPHLVEQRRPLQMLCDDPSYAKCNDLLEPFADPRSDELMWQALAAFGGDPALAVAGAYDDDDYAFSSDSEDHFGSGIAASARLCVQPGAAGSADSRLVPWGPLNVD